MCITGPYLGERNLRLRPVPSSRVGITTKHSTNRSPALQKKFIPETDVNSTLN